MQQPSTNQVGSQNVQFFSSVQEGQTQLNVNQQQNTNPYSPIEQQDARNYPSPNFQLANKLDGYDQPMQFFCTRCQTSRVSVLKFEPGRCTYACCCCLCCFTIVLGLLPFYLKDCQDVRQICPGCSSYVGQKDFRPCC